jgi:hypothetical protein
LSDVTRILGDEARTDAVGLWAAKQLVPWASVEELRRATLAAVRDALTEGHVVAGQFVTRDAETVTFSPWGDSADEIVARIDREWLALGRDTNLGDIVWFVAPSLLPLTASKHPMGKDWVPR